MKLWAMLCRATQVRWIMVESSDKIWSTGEWNGKPLPDSCLENPMNSMQRQKDRTLKDGLSRSVGAQCAIGDQWRNKPRKTEIWQVCRGGFQSIQNLVALREEILNSNRCQDESCFCFPHYLKCCSGSSWKKKQKQIFDEMTVLSYAYIRQFLWKGLKCFGQRCFKVSVFW